MSFSVIIPAFNAAATLGETLDSLLAQTGGEWEAIVINDGSTDETAAVAAKYASLDSRVRVITQKNGGMAAARNAGIARATGEWLLFLDSDDWMRPEALRRFSDAAAANPQADAIAGGWARVAPSGELVIDPFKPDLSAMFSITARFSPFPIHACVIRRRIVNEIGGFEPALRCFADWDLWQRAARLGVRVTSFDDLVALYRMRPDSAVINPGIVLDEGFQIIDRGHASDPRIARPDPRYAAGAPASGLIPARLRFLLWPAAMMLGGGHDARTVIDRLSPEDRDPGLEPAAVAHSLYRATLLPRCLVTSEWPSLLAEIEPRLIEFLQALERQSGAEGLSHRARNELERLIIDEASARPVTAGRLHAIALEVTEPLPDISPPPGVERLICSISFNGEPLGGIELPVCGPVVPSGLLSDAIVARHAWPILARFFRRHLYPTFTWTSANGVANVERCGVSLARVPEPVDPGSSEFHNAVGWAVFLQEVWGIPGWPVNRFYEETPPDPKAESRPSNQSVTLEVTGPIPNLRSAEAVEVEWTMGGVPIHLGVAQPVKGLISGTRLRASLTQVMGYELARVAVREALLGTSLEDGGSLRGRLARATLRNGSVGLPSQENLDPAATTRELLGPSWRKTVARSLAERPVAILGQHAVGAPGTSVSRRAVLPLAARSELLEAAIAAGEPVVNIRLHEGTCLVYAPELLWQRERADGGVRTPVSRVISSADRVRKIGTPALTHRLPILRYHRVAPGNPESPARYLVSPQVFAEQMAWLHHAGYYTVTLDQWLDAMRRHEPLSGRAVMITFDDGYRDFAQNAWPVLREFGFGAYVYLVTDLIGQESTWTEASGGAGPLLDWDEINRLRAEGVEFGSHTATHPHLEALPPVQIVRELSRSRAALFHGVGSSACSIAYPSGSEDVCIQHLAGACGYVFGLTCCEGLSSFTDSPLALPRVEVKGDDSLAAFITRVGG